MNPWFYPSIEKTNDKKRGEMKDGEIDILWTLVTLESKEKYLHFYDTLY